MMRAKMKVSKVTRYPQEGEHSHDFVEWVAVAKTGSYPADGSDENNSFARWTPNASLSMTIANPALLGKFSVGDTFYVDFTETAP